MDALSIFPAIAAVGVALFTTKLISLLLKTKPKPVKYASIDGLRGYLAFFVFLHHSSVWYFFLHTGDWSEPGSNLYNHFGKTSVSLFFMITGFLFFSKLIEAKSKPIDWLKLYIGRVMRLYPLYLFSVFILFFIAFAVTDFKLNEPISAILNEFWLWASFTIFGLTGINYCPGTGLITAGVVWSLIYEWLFYFSLPFLGLIFFRAKVSIPVLLLATAIAVLIYMQNLLPLIHIYTFAGGMFAAMFVRSEKFNAFAKKWFSSIIIIACMFSSVYFYSTAYELVPLLLISIAFILIACGNDLFGALSNSTSRLLGQMCYAIYLLHGMALFITFHFVIGRENAAAFSPIQYWLVICCCVVPLVLICYAAHRFIELPGMKSTVKVSDFIRKIVEIVRRAVLSILPVSNKNEN